MNIPMSAAAWVGISPRISVIFTSAPLLTNNSTTSSWPFYSKKLNIETDKFLWFFLINLNWITLWSGPVKWSVPHVVLCIYIRSVCDQQFYTIRKTWKADPTFLNWIHVLFKKVIAIASNYLFSRPILTPFGQIYSSHLRLPAFQSTVLQHSRSLKRIL